MTEKEKMVADLLSGKEREVIDVKFFRGSEAVISEEDFCREINRGVAQVKAGTAKAIDHLDRDKLSPKPLEEFLGAH